MPPSNLSPAARPAPKARRLLAGLALAGLTVTGTAVITGATAAPVAASPGAKAQRFAERVNHARQLNGMHGMRLSARLSAIAHAQAQRMAHGGYLFHNSQLGSQVRDWQAIGENVGVGGSVASVHRAFMQSSPHRANILGHYQLMGIGVAVSGDRVWVSEVFKKPTLRHPVLRRGSRGDAVRRVQHRLDVQATGYFGQHTQHRVMRFERNHGLVVNGVVGQPTWRALGI